MLSNLFVNGMRNQADYSQIANKTKVKSKYSFEHIAGMDDLNRLIKNPVCIYASNQSNML